MKVDETLFLDFKGEFNKITVQTLVRLESLILEV